MGSHSFQLILTFFVTELNGLPEEKILALKDKGVTQNVSHNIELDHLYWSAGNIALFPFCVSISTLRSFNSAIQMTFWKSFFLLE